ncbi:EamA family transporter RarD [Undibacterium cyanobacteriorum]|uniref:EamA family transporter RarD n=1 Tax=Undibacterium cyanobacteriorum TaxID=3073561 RepID=A0ABY9RCW7_9BURK|nr:EamA family transporter RarD [Undibacterium sp. 20NA77.5]WMW79067.1 EamA family transporter RarD [Undibacterium sp. 20NA77.5]
MRQGIIYAASCYLLWGLFPIYFRALREVAPLEILMHRMVWALLFLGIILSIRKQWAWLSDIIKQPRVVLRFAASAALLSTNWFIYIWSVNNERIVDASLGYFMTPLVNVLLGFLLLKEKLRPAQTLAVFCAAAGVAWMTFHLGHLPYIGLSLACTFGMYGLLRKTASLGALEGLSLETLILFPFAFAYLTFLAIQGQNGFLQANLSIQLLIIAAGPITAIPLLLFAAGARRIPMATLGLLQYISPSIQLLMGVVLYNEHFGNDKLIGFMGIWLGLILYSADGLRQTFFNKGKTEVETKAPLAPPD